MEYANVDIDENMENINNTVSNSNNEKDEVITIRMKNKYKDITKILNERFEKEKYEVISGIKRNYVIIGITTLFLIFINIILWVINGIPLVYRFLSLIISIPSIIGIIIYVCVRFFLFGDLRIIKGEWIKRVTKNYLIADFLLPQKKIISRICPLNEDGLSFYYGKGEYLVDQECIRTDENNLPHSFYVPHLPNPLKLDFKTYLDKAMENFRVSDLENFDDSLDVMYSAENLKIMKKDKFMLELHRDNREELNKIFLYFFIFSLAVLILIGIIVFLNRPQPIIINAGNMTSPRAL